jgi:Tripartite tricarboxylate transporter TctB family
VRGDLEIPVTTAVRGEQAPQDRRDLLTGLLYAFFGAAVAFAARKYPIGSLDRLGPGFFPTMAGVALVVIGVSLIGFSLRRKAALPSQPAWALKPFSIVLLSIVLFGALLEPMGLITAVPVLVGVSSLAHPGFSWRTLMRSIAVLLILSWAIFIALLRLPIPVLPPILTR